MKPYKKHILIIHGAGPKHYRSLKDGSGDWQAQLPSMVSSEFKVTSPQFPSPKNPSYEEWKILLEKNLAKLHGEVTFVGHSLGGAFLMKYLSENAVSLKITGLFLVAVPFNTMKGFEAPSDFSVLNQIPHKFLYHSLDDVEVPYAHALMFQDRLSAKLRTFSGQGHYFKRAPFPEIIHDIQNTSTSSVDTQL